MMEGGGHIMDNVEDDNAEWAVGDNGGDGNHKINVWVNVQQHNYLLSQHSSTGETGVHQQG
jgi:hypothetical protein